jgi:predicted PurR-regulated permease PerM
MNKSEFLDVSWASIIKIFIAILIFYLIYLTKEIVLWFFFALAISVLLEPAIKFLRKYWIPKILAVVIVYFSIFGILGVLIYLMAPTFISELKQLSENFPVYFLKISPALQQIGIDLAQNFDTSSEFLIQQLTQSSNSILNAIAVFFGGLASTAFIITTAFFLSLEEEAAERFFTLLSPKKYENNIAALFQKARNKISGWFGARILSCIFVGIASFIVFFVFGVKYPFILGLVAGILNFVPYIGPLITFLLVTVFVAVSSDVWIIIVYVLLATWLIQELDNKLLTPLLMKKLVDVPPVLVLISLLIGAKLFGFLGTIFAVPVFGIMYEFIKEFLERKKETLPEPE